MKKLILLALVALVAGAAFAETAPAFSGTFDFSSQMDFDNEVYQASDSGNEAVITMNGVVDEWSTVDAEISAGDGAGLAMNLNRFTLTTDITGALGIDGPVQFSLTWGALTATADIYQSKAGYLDNEPQIETDTYLGAALVFTIVEKVMIIATIAPSTYMGDTWKNNEGDPLPSEPVFGLEIRFNQLIDGLDANIWYITDENAAADPAKQGGYLVPESQIGVSAGYGSETFDAGFVFIGNLLADVFGAGVSGKYKMDIFDVGAAFGISDFSDTDTTLVGVNATYKAVPDTLDLFVAASFRFADFETSGYEAGVKFYFGATTYTLGYDYQNAGYEGPENTPDGGLFFKVFATY